MIKLVSWILRMVTGFFSLFILIWTIIGAFWLAASSTCKGKDPTAYRMQVRLCPRVSLLFVPVCSSSAVSAACVPVNIGRCT